MGMAKKKKKNTENTPSPKKLSNQDLEVLRETYRTLSLDELAEVGHVDDRFKALMVRFLHYLRGQGAGVSTDALIKFFSLYDSFDIFELQSMKQTLKPLLAKTKEDYELFDERFETFFYGLADISKEQFLDSIKEELIEERLKTRQVEQAQAMEALALAEQVAKEKEAELARETESLTQIEAEAIKDLSKQHQADLVYPRSQSKREKELMAFVHENSEDLKRQLQGMKAGTKSTLEALLTFNQPTLFNHLIKRSPERREELNAGLNHLMLAQLSSETPNSTWVEIYLLAASVLMKNYTYLDKQTAKHEQELDVIKQNTLKSQEKLTNKKQAQQHQLTQMRGNVNAIKTSIQSVEKEIEKEIALQHRPVFTEGMNSVRAKNPLEVLDQTIEKMNQSSYQTLTYVIKANAERFRTRLSRQMQRHQHKRFNYKKTMRESLKTAGVPMTLHYEKPKTKRTKMVCILDISGSCSKSSRLLLRFVYELAAVFSGGVRSYVFIKELADVSDSFKELPLDEAIAVAMKAAPREYSNYHHALKTFHEAHLNEIDRNAIVLFLGDARNNKNDSGVEYVKAIKERAKSVMWLNTEEKSKWNKQDSIIGLYGEHMTAVHQILTTNDLIKFLEQFNLN